MPDIGTGIQGASLVSSFVAGDEADEQLGAAIGTGEAQRAAAGKAMAQGDRLWALWEENYLPVARKELDATRRLVGLREKTTGDMLLGMRRDRRMWERHGYPMMQQLRTAAEQGPEDRFDAVRREAAADVNRAYDTEAGRLDREYSRYGVDPASGRGAAGRREIDLSRAGARASQVNRAGEAERVRQEQARIDYPARALAAFAGIRPASAPGVITSPTHVAPSSSTAAYSAAGQLYGGAGGTFSAAADQYRTAAGDLARFAFDNPIGGGAFSSPETRAGVQQSFPGGARSSGSIFNYSDVHGFAAGGMVDVGAGIRRADGPGTGVSDSIPVNVNTDAGVEQGAISDGEYVVSSDVADKIIRTAIMKAAGIEEAA